MSYHVVVLATRSTVPLSEWHRAINGVICDFSERGEIPFLVRHEEQIKEHSRGMLIHRSSRIWFITHSKAPVAFGYTLDKLPKSL